MEITEEYAYDEDDSYDYEESGDSCQDGRKGLVMGKRGGLETCTVTFSFSSFAAETTCTHIIIPPSHPLSTLSSSPCCPLRAAEELIPQA